MSTISQKIKSVTRRVDRYLENSSSNDPKQLQSALFAEIRAERYKELADLAETIRDCTRELTDVQRECLARHAERINPVVFCYTLAKTLRRS